MAQRHFVFATASALTLIFATAKISCADSLVTFEGLQLGEGALNYYNGGLGDMGSGPGPAYGITFPGNDVCVTSGNYSNEPSAPTIAILENDGSILMDVPAGFSAVSFYYTGLAAGSAQIYSGLDGAGSMLQNIPLPQNDSGPSGDTWTQMSSSFIGTGESVAFTGLSDSLGLDNIDVVSVPEPHMLEMFVAVAAMRFCLWRKPRRSGIGAA